MNLLCQTARIYRHNVGQLFVPSFASRRCLSSSQWKKYLNILDVNKDSSTKDIKESFLKLSKVYHPDNKTTGSHSKFVELKEAYDALKDGHPSITTSDYTNPNRYNNYYDSDVSYDAHKAYRDKYRHYTYTQSNYGFGGPYRNSSTPWEDLKRDQEYRRQQHRYQSYRNGTRGSGLINITIILSAMAWVIIYSCVLLVWDYRNDIDKDMFTWRSRDRAEYLQYQDYLRRKEEARLYREKIMKNSKFTGNDRKVQSQYIINNDQQIMSPPQPASSSPTLSPAPLLKPEAIDLKPSVNKTVPEVVGSL